MYKIEINKPPIAHIEIPEDLSRIEIYLNPPSTIDEAYNKQVEAIVNMIDYPHPEAGFLSYSAEKIKLSNLRDVDMKLAQLNIEFKGEDNWPVYSEFQRLGFWHTIQYPLHQLLQQGFLDQKQYTQATVYIQKHILDLRPPLQEKLQKLAHSMVFKHVRLIEVGFLGFLNPKREAIDATLRVLSAIEYYKGNLALLGGHLKHLLTNEAEVDAFLHDLKGDVHPASDRLLREALEKFKEGVKLFVHRHKPAILQVLETVKTPSLPSKPLLDEKGQAVTINKTQDTHVNVVTTTNILSSHSTAPAQAIPASVRLKFSMWGLEPPKPLAKPIDETSRISIEL